MCPCNKEFSKVADLPKHYFSCDRVPILILGGVALRLAMCHGQQTHGQRLADDYRRLNSLTANGDHEQVIGVTAAVQRAVDSMERVVKQEARHNREQMTREHQDTVRRLERVNTTLQQGNAALQAQIERLELKMTQQMAQNQHQLISTVQSTGRIITGTVNMSTDVTMRMGGAILDQAVKKDLKRKERDDDISAKLQQLLTLKQAAREPICSEDPVACTACTVLSEPDDIS